MSSPVGKTPRRTPPPDHGDAGDSTPPLDAAAANDEIAELRRKLSRLGSVNMEALDELAEVQEPPRPDLQTHDRSDGAKRSLEEIIDKINQDSRRLFTETFEAVRGHFQELFRKLFGGGMADVVLEDELVQFELHESVLQLWTPVPRTGTRTLQSRPPALRRTAGGRPQPLQCDGTARRSV